MYTRYQNCKYIELKFSYKVENHVTTIQTKKGTMASPQNSHVPLPDCNS